MDTELALPELLIELNNKDEKRRNTALDTAKQLPPEQLLELAALESEFYRKRRKVGLAAAGTVCVSFIILSVWLYHYYNWHFAFFTFQGFTCIAPLLALFIPKHGRRNVAKLISDTDDIRLIGTSLSMIQKTDDTEVRRLCVLSLKRLLPLVRSDQASILSPGQKEILLQQLKTPYSDIPLTLATLKALEQVGDERAIPWVERLAQYNDSVPVDIAIEVQESAKKCLPYLHQNVERQKLASTLLRGSAEPTNPNTLLRPVQGSLASETDTQQLLRAEIQSD